MKRNKLLEARRKEIPKEIADFVDKSFDIVDRIHEILEAKGLEQKDLARLLEKNESEISKWMTGTHNFTIKTITKIESVLDASILRIEDKKSSMMSKQVLFLVSQTHRFGQDENRKIHFANVEEINSLNMFKKVSPYLS
jgi:transcriptional regulator with XRE-family HTH domain